MVQTLRTADGVFLGWNLGARVGMGSTGDDVKLVQYLLARAPQAVQSMPSFISGDSGISVSDVDGVWGPQTDAAQKWFEQNYQGGMPVVADGVVDPVPPSGFIFGSDPNYYEYKISALQELYAGAAGGANKITPTIQNMPNDGQCPSDLAYALQAALNSSQASGAGAAGGG